MKQCLYVLFIAFFVITLNAKNSYLYKKYSIIESGKAYRENPCSNIRYPIPPDYVLENPEEYSDVFKSHFGNVDSIFVTLGNRLSDLGDGDRYIVSLVHLLKILIFST